MTVRNTFPKQRGKAKWVKVVKPHESESDSDLPMFHIGKPHRCIPLQWSCRSTKESSLWRLTCTGAAVSIISEETQKKLFPDVHLTRTPVKLRTYTGEPMPVVGERSVEVKYGSQTSHLSLIVVEGTGAKPFWTRLATALAPALEVHWYRHAGQDRDTGRSTSEKVQGCVCQ